VERNTVKRNPEVLQYSKKEEEEEEKE